MKSILLKLSKNIYEPYIFVSIFVEYFRNRSGRSAHLLRHEASPLGR